MTDVPELTDEEQVNRALATAEAMADQWAEEIGLVDMVKNAASVSRLATSVPLDKRDQLIARQESMIDAIAHLAFVEGAYRGFTAAHALGFKEGVASAAAQVRYFNDGFAGAFESDPVKRALGSVARTALDETEKLIRSLTPSPEAGPLT